MLAYRHTHRQTGRQKGSLTIGYTWGRLPRQLHLVELLRIGDIDRQLIVRLEPAEITKTSKIV